MNNKTILVIAAIIVVLGAGYAVARPGNFWNGMMGGYGTTGNGMMGGNGIGMMGGGMMGGYGPDNGMMGGYGRGNGMMGGYGTANGMMGSGGMMTGDGSGYGNHCGADATGNGENSTPITIDEAKTSVEQYLIKTGNSDLEIAEVLQFENNFYAGIKEKSTGKYAFELLVNKYTGAVVPEMGPNMMWNSKYGYMNIQETETKVTEEQALKNAQEYLDRTLPGTKVNSADDFYGYYTMEVTKDGNIYGMLSVNGYTGAVWYHNWHGTFEKVLEVD
ncbi:MAG: peptidase M4 [Candidatus Methanoperedens sp.]|nr:peptidase M4 [Candidatus Methanoperedens sp.]